MCVKLEEETEEEKAGVMRTRPLVESILDGFVKERGGFRSGDVYIIYAGNRLSREFIRNRLLNIDPVSPENIQECVLVSGEYIEDRT